MQPWCAITLTNLFQTINHVHNRQTQLSSALNILFCCLSLKAEERGAKQSNNVMSLKRPKNFRRHFANVLLALLHPFWNHWLSLQSDWLSAVRFIPKSHISCSKSHLFLSQWEWDSKTKQPIRFQRFFN